MTILSGLGTQHSAEQRSAVDLVATMTAVGHLPLHPAPIAAPSHQVMQLQVASQRHTAQATVLMDNAPGTGSSPGTRALHLHRRVLHRDRLALFEEGE